MQVGMALEQPLRLPLLQLGEASAGRRRVGEHIAQRGVAVEQLAQLAVPPGLAALVADFDPQHLHGVRRAC
jgi:hypothetical protein